MYEWILSAGFSGVGNRTNLSHQTDETTGGGGGGGGVCGGGGGGDRRREGAGGGGYEIVVNKTETRQKKQQQQQQQQQQHTHTHTYTHSLNQLRHSVKLSIPIPRTDLFESALQYSGSVLWN